MVTPFKNYFLIRINRQQEHQNKEKIGNIFLAPSQVFMTRNTQCGEVVAIGQKAHEYFPEVEVGHTLLVHHFVQSANEQEAREDHLVDQDENYNYYVVSAFAFHRKNVETYGVWDGEKIIPNKDYIFLEPDAIVNPQSPDEYINSALQKSDSGLFIFKDWKESREEKTEKIKILKAEIDSLCKSGTNKPQVATAIRQKEEEIAKLSHSINTRTYLPYTISAFNPTLQYSFSTTIENGDKAWMLNAATETIIEFNNVKYRVPKIEYLGCISKAQE